MRMDINDSAVDKLTALIREADPDELFGNPYNLAIYMIGVAELNLNFGRSEITLTLREALDRAEKAKTNALRQTEEKIRSALYKDEFKAMLRKQFCDKIVIEEEEPEIPF